MKIARSKVVKIHMHITPPTKDYCLHRSILEE